MNSLSKTGDIYISQSEFIGNLTAEVTVGAAGVVSSPFAIESYEINPGLSKLFPFLAQIAQNYDMYELEGLIVSYHPNSGETSVASNQLGKVILATNYDPDCSDFINSVEMQNYDYANAGKPSVALIHGIETHPHQRGAGRMLYVRDSLSTKDKVLTDLGKLFIATEGIPIDCSAAGTFQVVLGELHVAYRVRLSRAKLYNSLLGYGIATDRYKWEIGYGSGNWFLPAQQESWPYNHGTWSAPTYVSGNSYRVSASKQLVAGTYKFVLSIKVTTAATALSVSTVTADNSSLAIVNTEKTAGVYSSHISNAISATEDQLICFGYVQVNNTRDIAPAFTITLSRAAEAADATTVQRFNITQVSSKLTSDSW